MRALTPDRRATSPINTASPLLAGRAEGRDPLRLLDRELEPGIRVARQPFRGDRVLTYARVGSRHRGAQRRHDRLTEREQRPAEAQPRLTLAPPELRRQHFGQLGYLIFRHECDR